MAVGFLDQDPLVRDALLAVRAERTVAVGLFLDRGEHGEEDVPALLAGAGRNATYGGPVGVAPMVPDLILDQLRGVEPSSLAA